MSISGHPYWPLKYQTDINDYYYTLPKQYHIYPSNGYQFQNIQDTVPHRTNAHEHGNIELPTNRRKGWENSNQASHYDQVHDDEHETLTELEELGKPCNKVLHILIALYL